ncbi:MAG: ribosome-associated translation inhibitor RaiA [Nitrospirae bacterium]|nr:ribosome-associated translation inhibitor RaiA [Nitrospirota bacterium]
MQVTITGRHVEVTRALRDYAEEKIKKLFRYSFKPMQATVRLAVEKYRHMAEIVLWVDGNRILAKGETDEMYQSIDLAIEKIEQRLRKYKEKLSRHKLPSSNRSRARKALIPKPVVVRDAHIVSTLSLDDAFSRLASKKNKYLVFVDDADEKLKLLVCEKDDDFKITELIID